MDSFKLYLPSNASEDFFPNNTPSNYQTHLSDPIQLQGDWEAGLESIFYSTKIGDDKESVRLNLSAKFDRNVYVTSTYPYKYRISDDFKWPNIDFYPDHVVTNPFDVDGVTKCLNSMNRKIVQPGERDVFSFSTVKGKYIHSYKGLTNGILLDISQKMSRYLGFGWQHTFIGQSFESPTFPKGKLYVKEFKREDYHIRFVDTNVLKKIARVVIKESGRIFPKSTELLEYAWNAKITKPYNVEIQFSKTGRLVLSNKNDQIVIRFSTDFTKSFDMTHGMIGRKTEYAISPFDSTKKYERDFWYVDIYSRHIDTITKSEVRDVSFDFTPRRYDSVQHIIPKFNRVTEEKLKKTLASFYNKDFHKCELSLYKNHTKFDIGKGITLTSSVNLAFILGFDQVIFEAGNYISKRLPATLEQREQHLFILADFIQSTSYGEEKVDILQEFIHEGDTDKKRITEKRFHPIAYHPIKKSYIENIKIQLVNEIFKPITIRESKTVVILHLRKRK